MSEAMTPEMVQADRELDARIDYAFKSMHDVRGAAEEIDEKYGDEPPPTAEEVERFRTYITGHAHTEEWRVVMERIARGELTWRGIMEDFLAGRTDREVSAAFASLQRVPPATEQELTELGMVAPVEPEPPAAPEPEPDEPADTGFGGRFFAYDDDD